MPGAIPIIVSANATGTVGLTAVNGVATTFMRSDAAPALSQAIVPTWTGVHTFSNQVVLSAGSLGNGAVSITGGTATTDRGVVFNGSDWCWKNATNIWAEFRAGSSITLEPATQFAWTNSSGNATATKDLALGRNAANIVEVNTGTAGQWAAVKCGVRDAGTTTVTNGLTIGHQSTGTPAAGLGSALLLNINSSTTADQNAGRCIVEWLEATHATRKARMRRTAYDASAERETDRGWADGTYGRFACAAPNAAPTDAHIGAAQVSFYLDEGADKLHFRVCYADGTTFKTGEVALA